MSRGSIDVIAHQPRTVWVVGSRIGFADGLDDCIVHGIFTTEASAMRLLRHLCNNNVGDAYGIVNTKLNDDINISFMASSQSPMRWHWFHALQGDAVVEKVD